MYTYGMYTNGMYTYGMYTYGMYTYGMYTSYNVLTIASFRIGVPSILFIIKIQHFDRIMGQ